MKIYPSFYPPLKDASSILPHSRAMRSLATAAALLTIVLMPALRAENATEDAKFDDPTSSSFASDVAVSGDFALVGAFGRSGGGGVADEAGAVYSYQKIGGEWVFDEEFFAPAGEEDDFFGWSVAMFGDVAIIGAPGDDDPTSGDDSGSAYLFRHDGSEWVFEQKITASNAASNRRFGGAVAISGTVAVVGFRKQTGALGGEAYVFRYNGSTWVEEKILTASDAAAGDDFGAAVSVFDDVVVVGAAQKSGGGAAYIYRNTAGTTWGQEKILTASDGVDDDEFGDAVAVSGSLAIIGAYQVNGQLGAAYIYRNTGGTTWDDETRISRQNPPPPAGAFGSSVAISGEVALVGAPPAEGNKGTGHLFRFNGSEWVETVLVQSNRGDFADPSSNFWFGDSVALSEDYAIVGAAFDNGFGNNGAAFIYDLAPEITWNAPAAITYGTALSSTQLNASAGSVPGTFSYSPASGAVLDAGDHTLTVDFTPTDTVRYTSASKTVSITVTKATPTIAWNAPAAITYGTALGGTQFNATSSAPGVITYSPTAGTVLGAGNGQPLTATLPASANFNSATATVNINVNPAALTITADDKQRAAGTANPTLTASYSGFVNGDTALATPPTVSTTATSASASGTYPITVTGGSDGNYTITRVNGTLTVADKEIPVLTWSNPAAIVYGTALGGTQLGATSPVAGTFSYSPASGAVLGAGDHTLTVNFTPTDTARYAIASKTVSITVNKATPTIVWNAPAAITYGTGLGGTQLNASSSAPGTITYTPVAGTVLDAGNGQILTATLPASANFNGAERTVSINVNPAPLTITANDKQRGSGLANPTLTASYSGFVNSDTAIATPPSLTTTATPASAPGTYPITVVGGADPNYAITRQGGNLTVSAKEVPLLTWNDPAAITYGTALGAAQLNATSPVAGSFSYSPASGSVLDAGSTTLMATFTPTDATRYSSATKQVTLVVNKVPLTITADNLTREPGVLNPTLTATYSGFVNGDTEASLTSPPNLSTAANIRSGVGDYPITVSGAISANYSITYVSGVLMVKSAAVLTAMDDSFRVPLYVKATEGYAKSSDGSHFLPVLQNDEFEQPEDSIDGYTLRISEVANVGEIANAGQSLAILAFVGGTDVHVRFFDSSGAMAVDLSEVNLIGGNHLTELKSRLGPPAELGREPRDNHFGIISENRRKKIIASLAYVGSFAEFSTGVYFDSPFGPVDFKETDDGDFWSVGGGIRYAPKADFTGEVSLNYRWANEQTEREAFANIEVVDPDDTPNWGRFGEEIDGYGAYGRANAFAGVRWKPSNGLAVGAEYGVAFFDEIYTTIGNNDNLGGGLRVRAGIRFEFAHDEDDEDDDPDILALESDGQVLQTFEMLRPGLAALAAGEGDTVMFTQEMADSVGTLRDMIANVSSPSLNAAVAVISENVKEEDYVGKDFNGVVGNLGLDPDEFVVPLNRLTLGVAGFSVSTVELQGIAYSLWRSASLTINDWIEAEHDETSDGNGNITLTDPDAPAGAWFYRVGTSKQE